MENATKEQTACSGRTSTKATKEKRDNKKGVQQQARVGSHMDEKYHYRMG
jgi:hypothetical protein